MSNAAGTHPSHRSHSRVITRPRRKSHLSRVLLRILPAILLCGVVLAGCNLGTEPATGTATMVPIIMTHRPTGVALAMTDPSSPTDGPHPFVSPTAPPTSQPLDLPPGLRDVSDWMRGVCYEAADDRQGQPFVLGDDQQLTAFFDTIDADERCRRPIVRPDQSLADGEVLVGLWSSSRGCRARHENIRLQRDEARNTITISASHITRGDCSYELLRPLWLLVTDARNRQVSLSVTAP